MYHPQCNVNCAFSLPTGSHYPILSCVSSYMGYQHLHVQCYEGAAVQQEWNRIDVNVVPQHEAARAGGPAESKLQLCDAEMLNA